MCTAVSLLRFDFTIREKLLGRKYYILNKLNIINEFGSNNQIGDIKMNININHSGYFISITDIVNEFL